MHTKNMENRSNSGLNDFTIFFRFPVGVGGREGIKNDPEPWVLMRVHLDPFEIKFYDSHKFNVPKLLI